MAGILIIGASHSGVATAAALRSMAYGDVITLVTQETINPDHRPPLSKDGLAKENYAPAQLRPESFYGSNRIDLRRGVRIVGIDAVAKHAVSEDGTKYPYDTLVMACGAEPRRLPAAVDPDGIAHYLRTHDDFTHLKSRFTGARTIAIIGGGLIGVEIAAMALTRGMKAMIVEAGTRLMERTVSKSVANYVLDRHEANGLRVRFGASVSLLRRDSVRGVDLVTMADGATVEADIVVAAIGAVPHDSLAKAAGLNVDDGILCSEQGLTSDPAIYAVGDCSAWYDPRERRHVRNEAVNPGQDQAKTVAASIVGSEMPPRRLPRYWSHQAAIQIQMAGDVHGSEMEAVLKAPASGAFSVLGFRDGHLTAIQTINAPQQFGKLHEMIGMQRDALAAALDVEFPPPHRH